VQATAGYFSLRVAIVDDNRVVRELLRKRLAEDTSAVVVAEVDDGEHAARAVAESHAELVIMDYQMPGVDGVEATRRVKAAAPMSQVVAFSSAADDAVATAFKAAGAAACFDKTQIGELVTYVRSLTVRAT
jgi:DNA-binding NarL/FixJ family response regulator